MEVFRLRAELSRRVAFALVASPLLLAPALTGASTATAAETGPVITSPTADEQVGGEIQVTVESTAPEVLIAWEPEDDSRFVRTVPTDGGIATMALSTSGYDGPTTMVARECATSCDGAQTSVQVDVSNPPPQWEGQAWLGEFHGEGGLWGVHEDPWGWYGFFIDGEFVPAVDSFPFVSIDPATLGEGPHTVQMAHCTEHSNRIIEPVVCDMNNATEPRSFTVRTALHPTIDAVQRRVISPDGNGIADAATVTMTVDSPQIVTWTLARGVLPIDGVAGPLDSGAFRAPTDGSYTFDVDGINAGDPL